ncbi:enoyl-CoA hydratase/isomerase family protein [Streptomyces sp. NPDC057486]|uniref:enoyl-CoA hydratase/isomerase family protein n=1 Tax=Streptomyces sp. NPDC057486 TaxID=3346145 RepID=UPI0036B41356
MTCEVSMAVNDAIATLTIDNRTRANALTRSMLDALAGHLRNLDVRSDVAVVVLAGAGSNFCAGLDITEITAGRRARIVDDFIEVEDALAHCSKPTIAAVQGHCIGAGVQLAIACDLRIAARTARLAITPAKLGLVYPARSIERLVGTVGPAVTKRLLFTADMITADTALGSGLITDVVAEDEFDMAVARLAATVASRSPTTIAAAKQMTDHAASHGHVSSALHQRWRNGLDTDLAIGLAAYAAKRTPEFRAAAFPTT